MQCILVILSNFCNSWNAVPYNSESNIPLPPENNGFFLVNPESNGPPSESNVMDVKLAPFAC